MFKNTIERAFELAREGRCRSVNDIRLALKSERFENIDSHLSGSQIKKDLLAAIKVA